MKSLFLLSFFLFFTNYFHAQHYKAQYYYDVESNLNGDVNHFILSEKVRDHEYLNDSWKLLDTWDSSSTYWNREYYFKNKKVYRIFKFDLDDIKFLSVECTYNQNNDLIREDHFDNKNFLEISYSYFYENNKKVKEISSEKRRDNISWAFGRSENPYIYEDRVFVENYLYEESEDHLIKKIFVIINNTVNKLTTTYYNSFGSKEKEIIKSYYEGEEKIDETNFFEYRDGLLLKSTSISDGSESVTGFDKNGNKIYVNVTFYEKGEKDRLENYKYVYVYDKFNNWVKKTMIVDGIPMQIITREITYN